VPAGRSQQNFITEFLKISLNRTQETAEIIASDHLSMQHIIQRRPPRHCERSEAVQLHPTRYKEKQKAQPIPQPRF
jgi:hypothetical protein